MVLTAAHVVLASARVRVRFVADDGTARTEPGRVIFREDTVDLAVIRLDEGSEVEPVSYGRLADPLPVEAIGFPRFRLHQSTAPDGTPITFRDTRHARGTANPASWRREGGLEIVVEPPAQDPDPQRSAWEGMSGAAVWSVGHLIGVVSEHRPGDALNTLTCSRVDRWYTDLDRKQLNRLHGFIGLPPEHRRLVTVTPHTIRLDAYLNAGTRAADEYPQPDVFATRPSFSKIYTPQSVRQQDSPGPPDVGVDRTASPASIILDAGGDAVVVAGPGGGKSSLLRRLLVAGIDRWQRGHPGAEVPVLIQASDLVDEIPLSGALAAAASRSLARSGLLDPLPADFFRAPPRPRGRWLVLVDSLDEIIDIETRERVLRMLASVSSPAHRFVVSTRPLPDRELEVLGSRFLRYELLPLASDQIAEFGERWFAAAGAADPVDLARSFIQAIKQAAVQELARTPLMATMLCQLHMADQDAPLSAGRSKIFARFTVLLSERFHSRGAGGIYVQARAALERYGPGVVGEAENVIARIHNVIEQLAVRQNKNDGVTTTQYVADHPDLCRPEPVAQPVWDEFVRDALRRTGLLVGDDLRFFHRTVTEYLSARHVARDKINYATALRESLSAVDRRLRATEYMSVPDAAPEASYLGFLLDAGEPPEGAIKLLDGVATGRNVGGCEFIADLARLGTMLPPATVQQTTRAIWKRLNRKRFYSFAERARAVTALSELDPDRGVDLMAEMSRGLGSDGLPERNISDAEEPRWINQLRYGNEGIRVFLALRLGERGDARGPALLIAMARDPRLVPMARARSGGALVDLDHPDAAEILLGLATDHTMTTTGRILAARLLGVKLHDRRAAGLLLAIARDESRPPHVRAQAAFSLARLDDSRGTSILLNIARHRGRPGDQLLTSYSRYSAATFLGRLGDRRAVDILDHLSRDETIEPFLRHRARRARARYAGNSFGQTVEQRALGDIAEMAGGTAQHRIGSALGPIFRLFFPLIVRRYSREIAMTASKERESPVKRR
jgi:hypothetical protein